MEPFNFNNVSTAQQSAAVGYFIFTVVISALIAEPSADCISFARMIVIFVQNIFSPAI